MTDERPVANSPRIVENHAGQACYLVEYDEDQWNRYTPEQRENCFDAWVKKAKPLGAVFVVLKLFPDPVFPSGDKTAPYVVRTYPIEQETFNPITLSCTLRAQIHTDSYVHAKDEGTRMKLKIAARQFIAMHAMASPGCSYEIWHRDYAGEVVVLERGRL